jgi:hypothetical protein
MINIDELLSEVYKLDGQKNIDAAIDIIIEFFWDAGAEQNYKIMNEFYEKIDVSNITDGAILCAPVMNTFKYIPQIPEHIPYCMRAIERYKELGYADEKIHNIMDRYLQVGNYWHDMSLLNAPEWLAGKKPE